MKLPVKMVFPDVENPIEELLCITVKNQSNKQIITWGVGQYKTDRARCYLCVL